MTSLKEVETAIIDRVILVNAKSRGPVANIFSPYIVIDIDRDRKLCEMGLCQYIYVVRRKDIPSAYWLNYNLDKMQRLEKLFDLDFFDEFVEFFNSVCNTDRFEFIGYTNEEIIKESFTEWMSCLAEDGLLRTCQIDQYLNITPLSIICIVEDDGTIGVYQCH